MHKLEENINNLSKKILLDYQDNRTIDEVKTFDHPDNELFFRDISEIKAIASTRSAITSL